MSFEPDHKFGSSSLERAAAAIKAAVPIGYGMTSAEARIYARVAIEAIQEPTPEMIGVSWAKLNQNKRATGILRLGPGPGVREVWEACIEEILKKVP